MQKQVKPNRVRDNILKCCKMLVLMGLGVLLNFKQILTT